MNSEWAISILQLLAGLILMITTGIAGWCLLQVVKLKSDVAGLKVQSEDTDRRFGETRDWLQSIAGKLDALILGLLKDKGP